MGFYEDNPTEYGVAASLGHPGENVTGLAAMEVEACLSTSTLYERCFRIWTVSVS